MLELTKYCEYLYGSLYIPVYLYNDKSEPVYCYPPQESNILPPPNYISKLVAANKKVHYIMTTFNSYYGSVRIENKPLFIILGPINNIPYTKHSLAIMQREFSVATSDIEKFCNFFCSIPPMNIDTFINILIFINYTISGEMLSKNDVVMSSEHNWNSMVNIRLSNEMYQKKEEGIINNSYEIENKLMEYIEMGNLKGLYRFLRHPKRINGGILANDSLRHAKNMFICAITLAARAAIRGGLSPQTAFQLSDIYIQLAEQLKDIESINSLLIQAMVEYTNRVANASMPVTADSALKRVIEYVRINTNKNITVSDIAKNFGFSRSYLSHKFKKTFGIELKAFIMKCKLEEAKFLLKYSNKSISEISSYLCFSNQSHFQRAFKKQYGVTPHNYRKTSQLNLDAGMFP